jgi:hypothetical protein
MTIAMHSPMLHSPLRESVSGRDRGCRDVAECRAHSPKTFNKNAVAQIFAVSGSVYIEIDRRSAAYNRYILRRFAPRTRNSFSHTLLHRQPRPHQPV